MSRSRRLALLTGSALTIASLDLITKQLAQAHLSDGSVIVLLPGVLELQLAYNSGIAFSMPLTGAPLIIVTLILMTIITIMSIMITLHPTKIARPIEIIGYGLIIGGGIGNAIERVSVARVTDFLHVPFFANCNIADVGISLGVILLILSSLPISRLCHSR